jgi:hypothetical protein
VLRWPGEPLLDIGDDRLDKLDDLLLLLRRDLTFDLDPGALALDVGEDEQEDE